MRCRNEQPGYRCEQCPSGYKQSGRAEGIGLDDARRYRQVCEDIDECTEYENVCVQHSDCINTPVIFFSQFVNCSNSKNEGISSIPECF